MPDLIMQLRCDDVRPHPDNRPITPASVADLVASIQSQGVLSPILVRPIVGAAEGEQPQFEIVYGHRRHLACCQIPAYVDGTRTIPGIVRAMDDRTAELARAAENMQREDLTCLQAADQLARLHGQHGMSADDIATQLGMSRSYVYGRLKLARATDAVRDAVTTQGLSPELALEVARMAPKLQRMALQRLRAYGDEWHSYRHGRTIIRTLLEGTRLDRADWDLADRHLIDTAGACTTCPMRAGNDPALADIPADVCTDPACYDRKQRAHTIALVPRLRAAGHTVFDADEAAEMKLFRSAESRPADYYDATDSDVVRGWGVSGSYEHLTLDDALAALQAAGVSVTPPQRVTIVNPHTGVAGTYITDAARFELNALWDQMVRDARAASTPPTAAQAADGSRSEPRRDPMADWTGPERAMADHAAAGRVLDATLAAMMRRPRTADDLRLVLLARYDQHNELRGRVLVLLGLAAECEAAADDLAGLDFDERRWWMDRLATLTGAELGQIVVGLALESLLDDVTPYGGREPAAAAVAVAASYGIDVMAAANPAPPAAPAQPPAAAARAVDGVAPASDLVGAELARLAKRGVKYRCAATGMTWTGRGLQPAWLKAGLANGKTLADYALPAAGQKVTDGAGAAGEGQTDGAGGAAAVEPGTSGAQVDAFEGAQA